jgi:cyclophilin family peptidyl-prolyl cis-trans isomerase
MPPADKRARKKETARAAREQREAAIQRKKRMRTARNVGIVVAIFVGVIVLLNVLGGDSKKAATPGSTTTTTEPKLDPAKNYVATITTNFGDIKIQLDAKKAPIAAGHFVNLARKGVYDGSRWSRVVKGFVIQGGAPGGDKNKAYGSSVVGELSTAGYALGDVAAAKTPTDPSGSFDAQFFVVTGPEGEALPHDYTDFGHVTSGMAVVRKIEALPTDAASDPTQKATIDKVTIKES